MFQWHLDLTCISYTLEYGGCFLATDLFKFLLGWPEGRCWHGWSWGSQFWALTSKTARTFYQSRIGGLESLLVHNSVPLCLESAHTVEKTQAEASGDLRLCRGPDGVWLCTNNSELQIPCLRNDVRWGVWPGSDPAFSLLAVEEGEIFSSKKQMRSVGLLPRKYTEIHNGTWNWWLGSTSWKLPSRVPSKCPSPSEITTKEIVGFSSPKSDGHAWVFSPSYSAPALPLIHHDLSVKTAQDGSKRYTSLYIHPSPSCHSIIHFDLLQSIPSLCQEELLHTWLLCSPAS